VFCRSLAQPALTMIAEWITHGHNNDTLWRLWINKHFRIWHPAMERECISRLFHGFVH
jgi:hypothetical protein